MARKRIYPIYCDPVELHDELMTLKSTKIVSNKLGIMFQNIIDGIFSRPNFSNYDREYAEEMKFCAIKHLILYTSGYDPKYYITNQNAAFTYCSRIVFQCFTMTITILKKKTARNKEIIDQIYDDNVLSRGYKVNNRRVDNE